MALEAVVYTSSAVGDMTGEVLEGLLVRARAQNEINGVTGVLLYHDGSFLQYFEGPPNGVAVVYDRIKASVLHRGIVELMHRPIEERAFSEWLMGFTRAPESDLLRLENASWKEQLEQGQGSPAKSDGVELLHNFWLRYTSDRRPGRV